MGDATEHPIGRVWDVLQEIAVDGSMTGVLDYDEDGVPTGRMTFDTEDGRRFSVHVDED